MTPLPQFEVWVDDRLLYLTRDVDVGSALVVALREFPRRAVKVRAVRREEHPTWPHASRAR